ncbi:MAG: response regulator [Anaerolineales bacterium]|nr:response regulator [Anaerolineales bacterium]MCX7756468.1 response regulator [Anaerolineales bacterium]MDW8278341.1 response regulator [Anaerolineales bacterium]
MTTILLVEDIPDTVELVRRALTAHGYDLLHAPDAETGLQMALEHHPALILLDLGLPDYDGQTLAGWLRAEPALQGIPIVAFTAWPQETARRMVESYGCNGYIPKPIVRVKEFIELIETFLTETSRGGDAH